MQTPPNPLASRVSRIVKHLQNPVATFVTIKSYGEFNLIDRIRERVKGDDPSLVVGPGDDTAAIKPNADHLSLLSTDTFVEGLDFRRDYSSWHQIGWKAMAANLSDIAAMGGRPRFALLNLCLPDDTEVSAVDEICDGMVNMARAHGVLIIGGDLSGTPGPLTISVTVSGEVTSGRVTRRSGAKVGDVVCVTGNLGGSEAGLRILSHNTNHADISDFPNALDRHRAPKPRVQEGQILADSGHVTAMIDISDGLSADILHIAKQSRTGVCLKSDSLPITEQTRAAASFLQTNATDLALNSGEEFELLCTLSDGYFEPLHRQLLQTTGTELTEIGEITSAETGYSLSDGSTRCPLKSEGFDHFKD